MKKLLVFTYTLDGSGSAQVLFNIVSTLGQEYSIIIISLHGGSMEEKFKLLSIPVKSFIYQSNGKLCVFNRLKYAFYTLFSLLKNWPSAVVFNTSRNFIPAFFTLFFPFKTVLIAHETHLQYKNRIQRTGIIYTALFSGKIVVVSNYLKKCFIQVPLLKSKEYQVIYNGIDFISAIQKSNEKIPNEIDIKINGRIVLGQIGLITPNKNTSFLIDLLSKLNENDNKYVLLVVGDFSDSHYREQIENKIDKFGLKEKVFITGYVNNVYPYLKKMNILYVVSKIETFGLVALEAMLLNVPVIAKRLEALEELLGKDYKYLIDEYSEDDFFNKTIEISENQSVLLDIKNHYLNCTGQFALDYFSRSYHILFKDLMTNKL